MPVSEFGRQILSKKYYGPGETEPEHLFRRVAKVCSIPDVIDYLLKENARMHKNSTLIPLSDIFGEYAELAFRVWSRRYYESDRCLSDVIRKSWVDDTISMPLPGVECIDKAIAIWGDFGSKYFEMINSLDFMPATPTLMNAGRGGMLSSCFAIRVPDSMEGIFDVVKEVALISKAGGGVGLDLSLLRGQGAPVGSTGGVSSGVISFMRVFNEAGNQVKQGGFRRAALLGGLRVDHPDILEFIKCKDKEGELSNFNISVFVTDAFMHSVKNDELINLWHEKSAGTRIPARKIWDFLVEHATHNGEPGIIFQDRLDEGDITQGKYGKMLVNPCQPGFSNILTPDGIKTFDDIFIGSVIWSGTGWTRVINKICTGEKEVFNYSTNAGEFIGTENHKVSSNGNKLEIGLATGIDMVTGPSCKYTLEPQSIMDGLLIGDGTVHKASNNLIVLYIGEKDHDYFSSEVGSLIHKASGISKGLTWRVTTQLNPKDIPATYERIIPDKYFRAAPSQVCGFLRGLYSANGSICAERVMLRATSLPLILQVQKMLSSVGILSYYTTDKQKDVKFSNGVYTCKQAYALNINADRGKFRNMIGFIQKYKQRRLDEICDRQNRRKSSQKVYYKIKNVKSLGFFKVYAITVESSEHSYWTDGTLAFNCGELPLKNYSSCNLGSINLSNFYDEKINTIDLEKLENTIRLGVRFLDNVIDLNKYPLDKIEEITLKLRPIGLGTMGLHDLMLKSSIEYGSKKSLGFIDAIYSTIKRIAIDESTTLGRFRGIPEDLREFNVSRRNGSLLTVPPTGTVSQIAGCSSGIEPNFAWEYTRKDSYGEHKVKHFILDRYGDGPLPTYAKTALEISPEAHVLVQSQTQKYVDSSISKTVNLPFEATKEDVDKIYKLAFDSGCKSITVYRSGSRIEEVLTPKKSISNNNSVQQEQKVETMEKLQKDISTEDPQSRPRERVLFGATFSVNTPSGKCYVTINEDDFGIREVFINIAKAGSDLVAYTESLGRLISSMLKFKLPIQTIISQLEGQKSSPTWDHGRSIKSVPDAVAKLLQEYRDNLQGFSQYIDDPLENKDNNAVVITDKKETNLSGEFCVDCGEMLRREGGCEVCKNCGYSKCS